MHAVFLSHLLHINYSPLHSEITSYFPTVTASQAICNNIWIGSMIIAVLGGLVYGTEMWSDLARRGEFRSEDTNREMRTEKVDWGGDTDVEE
jgi:hypothetical protein